MIVDLDDDRSLDPGRVGAKAAWLARGRRAGLPVLPGFVIESRASGPHIRLGEETLERRGSGGARLAVSREPLAFEEEVKARGARLGRRLVARSSTTLEASGAWSGAFASYLDLSADELPRGVVGCWASVFSVATLELLQRAGIGPGSVSMAVLVQPALEPDAGGTARIDANGVLAVFGVQGPPGPLLQGWASGAEAIHNGEWVGEELIDLVGRAVLDRVAAAMRAAAEVLGATHCEWAVVDDDVWLLQLGIASISSAMPPASLGERMDDPILTQVARTVVMAPGPMGEEWVLPWALGGMARIEPIAPVESSNWLVEATRLSAELVSGVWSTSAGDRTAPARRCLSALRGLDPDEAVDEIRRLRPPDPGLAGRLLGVLAAIRAAMVSAAAVPDEESAWYLTRADIESVLAGESRFGSARLGIGLWEPFLASVVIVNGDLRIGTPASPGVGAGRRCHLETPTSDGFRPRNAISAPQAVPGLAPLLWDAAGLVTAVGSPDAHLFESARAMGVPAVCGVNLAGTEEEILAVDGYGGVVATLALDSTDSDQA